MAEKEEKESRPVGIDIEKLKANVDSFDEKMNEIRREFIQKSSNSKKSASDVVLTS